MKREVVALVSAQKYDIEQDPKVEGVVEKLVFKVAQKFVQDGTLAGLLAGAQQQQQQQQQRGGQGTTAHFQTQFHMLLPGFIPSDHMGEVLIRNLQDTMAQHMDVHVRVIQAEQRPVKDGARGSRVWFQVEDIFQANKVVSHRWMLKDTGITIHDCLSPEELAEQKRLWPKFLEARAQKKRANFSRAWLYIDGKRYTVGLAKGAAAGGAAGGAAATPTTKTAETDQAQGAAAKAAPPATATGAATATTTTSKVAAPAATTSATSRATTRATSTTSWVARLGGHSGLTSVGAAGKMGQHGAMHAQPKGVAATAEGDRPADVDAKGAATNA